MMAAGVSHWLRGLGLRGLVADRLGPDRPIGAWLDRLRGRPAERLVPIAHGDWHGKFLIRNDRDHIQRIVATGGGFYEAEMLEDIRQRLPRHGLFVDVGANIGNHTLFAAGVCGARTIAFEPSPALADHCAAMLAANGLTDRVDLRRQGAGAAAGRARLRPGSPNNAGETSLDPAGDGDIPVIRLDEALTEAPDVVKVDVEGMECAVLEGARGMLGRRHPVLYVEAATDRACRDVKAVLEPLGYRAEARFNHTPTWLFLPHATG